MATNQVLVRGSGGKPVIMVALDAHSGLIFVANPRSLDRISNGESWPVGVPTEDVFQLNETAFSILNDIWHALGTVPQCEWESLGLIHYGSIVSARRSEAA